MSTFGQRLRTEREGKGLGRVDVAKATKVAVHHLAALEYGDFAELPDAVHTKGFVRAYAEYLGLDPATALAEFLDEYEAACPKAAEDPRDEVVRQMSKILGGERRSWFSRFRPALIVAAAVLVVAFGWFWLGRIDLGGSAGSDPTEVELAATPTVPSVEPAAAETVPEVALPEPVAETPTELQVAHEETPPQPGAEASSPPPTASSARTPRPGAGRLKIREYGVGTSVENLQLMGESNRFRVGTRVWFWTRVLGARSGEKIRHVWTYEGRTTASIPLTLGSANWRTYSRKTMYAAAVGAWAVEAVGEDGTVLARSEFVCGP